MCYVENKDGETRNTGHRGSAAILSRVAKEGLSGTPEETRGKAIRIIQAGEDGLWLGPRLWPWK